MYFAAPDGNSFQLLHQDKLPFEHTTGRGHQDQVRMKKRLQFLVHAQRVWACQGPGPDGPDPRPCKFRHARKTTSCGAMVGNKKNQKCHRWLSTTYAVFLRPELRVPPFLIGPRETGTNKKSSGAKTTVNRQSQFSV